MERTDCQKGKGAFDKVNGRRAPTVFNAALQFKAHWRGDRENVESQASQAATGPASFGNPDNASTISNVKAIRGYRELFQRAPGATDVYGHRLQWLPQRRGRWRRHVPKVWRRGRLSERDRE